MAELVFRSQLQTVPADTLLSGKEWSGIARSGGEFIFSCGLVNSLGKIF